MKVTLEKPMSDMKIFITKDMLCPPNTHPIQLYETMDYIINEEQKTQEDLYFNGQRELAIDTALKSLKPREAQALKLHYGIAECRGACTLVEVGYEMGVTGERVRQIITRALEKIRRYGEMSKLREFCV